ncbi:peptidyl-prolyl cis-trans isomerase [Burkholderia multivorans]|uniref:peptidylprolyl isomerase n=1 Tax=Burkholderia multivorans TaxID=87883 RepID=UPI000CFF9304|nr:peptidyl-prolyl cis-trans isomerase [Burkholderia multivorans]MBJ9618090.1 peptidyl-prolyl cis-trans isomerase [Burkholderia multivorans]MBJ9621826.1 peptidyl-prolyl cis-trans isomerase [Burkholderia multivorans]MBU9330916.1 peptidyl-prolyl cis-trans isomerase [Burkholderia multivorans]MBU9533859.1 peptidyl-prolyl cis-trans isomerase [Burkholderia multivorans]MDR8787458.1 putative parvulin-type peptidyl-prolyl cis-trans isomerase [Burkholderia multivorans]
MNRLSNGRTVAMQSNRSARLRKIAVTLFAAAVCGTVAPHSYALNKAAKKPADAAVALPADAVASVNGVPITQAQIDEAVRVSKAPDTPALRTALKNQLIARELFRQAALKQHYDTKPQVVAAVEQAKTLAMTQAYLSDQVKPVPVTEADVKARYDAIVATLGENEYKPSVIAVNDADTAKQIIARLKKGEDFAKLAQQFSKGPAAAQGGALNWISFKTPIEAGHTQNWPQPLAEALVKLPQGGLTREPVQVGDAYWIVRADDKRPTQVPTFDQAKDTLRQQLEQVAMEKATAQVVADLIRGARIQQ